MKNCVKCKKNPLYKKSVSWCLKCFAQVNKRNKLKVRAEVLHKYGGNPPKCACCGETEEKFLALDHINNDGAKERKVVGTGSHTLYSNLKKRNFPPGYQVLCHNCNSAKQYYGQCPHRKVESRVSS